MEILVKQAAATTLRCGCLIAPAGPGNKLRATAATLDEASKGRLTRLLKRGDLGASAGSTLMVPDLAGVQAQRVLLVRTGNAGQQPGAVLRKAASAAIRQLAGTGARDAATFVDDWTGEGLDTQAAARTLSETALAQSYRFDEFKSEEGDARGALRKLTLAASDRQGTKAATAGAKTGRAIGLGVNLARDLGNRPANVCTPSYLAEQARNLKRGQRKLSVAVLDEKKMRDLGMGSLLSVASGSRQPPRLIVLEYRGASAKSKPIVLVGKGVTFDTGGISIKPAAAMDEMKFDMCGAASVFGCIKACLELGLERNVVGLVPATENMPDGQATRPGDIVKSMSGQTIEILNTDAEGRLILCDALTYAERFEPEAVIDIATLTGACVIALGEHAAGLMSNDDRLADDLLAAGQESDDRCWRLPLWDDYQEALKSNFADMANVGGRAAGTITAACFLSRFTGKYRWAHLDIAGTAWLGGKNKGATGRPVRLLMQYLLAH